MYRKILKPVRRYYAISTGEGMPVRTALYKNTFSDIV